MHTLLQPARDMVRIGLGIREAPTGGPDAELHMKGELDAIDDAARRHEIMIWEVLLPHLIRNAPTLASETVTTLRDNHREEKQLITALRETLAGAASATPAPDQVEATATDLVEVLEKTLELLHGEVTEAFESLPREQREAIDAVARHELSRSGPDDDMPSVAKAMAILEGDRNSLPAVRPPHASDEDAA